MASLPPGVPTSTTRTGSIVGGGGVAAAEVAKVGDGANVAAVGFAVASGAAGRIVGGGSAPRGGAELLVPRTGGGTDPRGGGTVD